MCFGGPKPPKVKYKGPSKADIRRQEEGLARYEQQIQEQQAATTAALEKQIAAAEAQQAKIQAKYDEELNVANAETAAAEAAATKAAEAAKAAGASYTPAGAYGVTASKSDVPTAETTTAQKAKKKPKGTLKISPTATANAGSGLNIGV